MNCTIISDGSELKGGCRNEHEKKCLIIKRQMQEVIWQLYFDGYYVDTVGKNTKKIKEYISNQLQEDIMKEQLSLFETTDPFTGQKYKKK